MALSPKVVILIFLGIIGVGVLCYFLIKTRDRKNDSGDSGGGGGTKVICPSSCPTNCNPDGTCVVVSECGPKPNDTADCTYICDPTFTQWRCSTACDGKDGTDYRSCNSVSNLGCNSNNQFFCKNSEKCSDNGQYILQSQKCVCNAGYTGEKCNCPTIPNCYEYNETSCKCKTCSSHRYHGDACDPCPDNQEFDGKNCVCIDGYKEDLSGTCVKKDDKQCNGGTLSNGKCVCLVNDGAQYYGDSCQYVAKCDKKEEFTWSGNSSDVATCDCPKNTSKVMCGPTCSVDPGPCQNGGTMTCDNGCVCPTNYTGKKCQCPIDNQPTVDACKGQYNYCGDNGWTTQTVTTCSDLYNLNGGSEDLWIKKCLSKSDQCDPTRNNSLTCSDASTGISIKCQGFCPKASPTDECKDVWKCDSTTGYDYKCVPQQPSSQCKTTDGFCADNLSPKCAVCGNAGSELVCQGNSPSQACVNAIYGNSIKSYTDKNGAIYWIHDYQNSSIPIYPTIDNTICKQGTGQPTEMLSQGTYNGYTVFNSENGYIENGEFTPSTDQLVKYTYAFNSSAKDDIKVNCWWKDDEIVSYLGGKQGDKICSGRGDFKQDKNSLYNLKSGKCVCTDYTSKVDGSSKNYVGSNCQYDDNTTCNGVGTALENGSCLPMNLIVAFDTDAPPGWAECDGTQGTPDIIGRFIMGGGLDSFSGGVPALYTTGGEDTHILTLDEMPEHEHLFSTTAYTANVNGGTGVSCVTQSPTPPTKQFTTENDLDTPNAFSLMPPYKVVVFAMRKSNLSSDSLPVGSIIWYYTTAPIPTGWKKYDAQQRFLLGREKGVYTLGSTGGATEIVLNYTNLPLHQHSYNYPYRENFDNFCRKSDAISCPDFNVINDPKNKKLSNTSSVGSDTPSSIPILPPYRSLYCIQKTDKSADIPVGAICAWANKDGKTKIPTGWVVCDTTNNSPDLRGYFVYADNNIVGSGGTNSIGLTSDHLPSHYHLSNYYRFPFGYNLCESSSGVMVSDVGSNTEQVNSTSGIVGKSATQKSLQTIPPYIVLLYIMKVF